VLTRRHTVLVNAITLASESREMLHSSVKFLFPRSHNWNSTNARLLDVYSITKAMQVS